MNWETACRRGAGSMKIFLGFLLLVAVFLFGICQLGLEKRLFGGELFRVATPSMAPAYTVGDYVVVEPVDPEGIRKGDVILFISSADETAGMLIAHRVLQTERADDGALRFLTAGDAAPTQTELVSSDFVRGRVTGKSAFVSAVGRVFSSGWFLVCAVLLPAVLFVLSQIGCLICGIRRKQVLNERIAAAGLDPGDKALRDLIEAYGESVIDELAAGKQHMRNGE